MLLDCCVHSSTSAEWSFKFYTSEDLIKGCVDKFLTFTIYIYCRVGVEIPTRIESVFAYYIPFASPGEPDHKLNKLTIHCWYENKM